MKYTPNSLRAFANAVLQRFGCNKNEAAIVADHLIGANLAGHDSHGIGMLPMYGLQVNDGNLIPNQTPDFLPTNGAISIVDAKKGFGHRMTLLALDHALGTVPANKVAVLALRNSGHISRVGTYSEYCAARGYVSMHFVNVIGHDPIVAPFGSREGAFSTNPISMAMPIENTAKPLLDIATSTAAFGKVRVASNKGNSVPAGWLVDAEGVETTDPKPMAENMIGALSAFGAYKGSGLGIFAELFAGALAGTGTINDTERFPNGVLNNMLSIIIDPAGFDDPSAIANRVSGYCEYVKDKSPAKGTEQVLLPGDPENISREKREGEGIEVDPETLRQIGEVAGMFDQNSENLEALLHVA